MYTFGLTKTEKIIDIRGGEGKFADHLLDEVVENIIVLHIAAQSLNKVKNIWVTELKKNKLGS